MTPEQLLTFAYVADAGNISRAGEMLHLSQPAVSGQLRALQDWFGEPLYRRRGHGVVLTSAGERLADQARLLRQAYGQARAVRDDWRNVASGTLRLGASTTPASYLLPALVAEFRQRYPAVTLHLSDGNTAQIVQRLPLLDMAFIEGEVPTGLPADTEAHAWRRDEVVAVVRADHPLGQGSSVTLDQLASYSLVMREPGSGVRRLVEQAFAQSGLAPEVALELAGVEGVKQAVRAGLGVGFVSVMSMRHEDGALKGLRIGAPGSTGGPGSPGNLGNLGDSGRSDTPNAADAEGLTRTLSILLPHAAAPARAAALFLELCRREAAAPVA